MIQYDVDVYVYVHDIKVIQDIDILEIEYLNP